MRGQRSGETSGDMTQGRWSESLETQGRGDQGAGASRLLEYPSQADEALESVRTADIAVDGIAGTGLDGPLPREYFPLVDALNGSAGTVVAVDVPSGTGRRFQVRLSRGQSRHHVLSWVAQILPLSSRSAKSGGHNPSISAFPPDLERDGSAALGLSVSR